MRHDTPLQSKLAFAALRSFAFAILRRLLVPSQISTASLLCFAQ
jgi:hypothetical protein